MGLFDIFKPKRVPTPIQRPDVAAPKRNPSGTAASQMSIDQAGVNLIKAHEGFRANAYICPAGVPTIGYGSTAGVRMGMTISQAEGEKLLLKDLVRFETAVQQMVKVPLTQSQYNALVSFAFNVGTGALKNSTLLLVLNTGDYKAAGDQFLRWNKGGGKVLAGLDRRRKEERALFLK